MKAKDFNQGIYGRYKNLVSDKLMSKEEAAYLARVEYRRNALITALNSMKNAGEYEEMNDVLKMYVNMK